MGPPSSKAIITGQILGPLSHLFTEFPNYPQTFKHIGDASRLNFADPGRYVPNSDFVLMPTQGLLAQDYFSQRTKLPNVLDALTEAVLGYPEYSHALLWTDDVSLELHPNSRISIFDCFGYALSMTTTIENSFGSRLLMHGSLLNNGLPDFSFKFSRQWRPYCKPSLINQTFQDINVPSPRYYT